MSDEQGRIWVGAFGKHPGWDDHIADQGLETELLTRVKRLLYLEGIGGNLDSGAWSSLDAEDRIDGFNHVFLWRFPGGLVAGRLWNSSDGKGRTRYPMIVCAHCRGLASAWVAGPCLDLLGELSERCKAATDAAGVITAVDDARRHLRSHASSAPLATTGSLDIVPALVEISDCKGVGEDGLLRVVYQLEREFSSFLTTDEELGTKSRTIDIRPRHMRVPACHKEPGPGCDLWLRFLLERVDAMVPVLALVREGEETCDLIAGEPTRGQFACLQSSLERVPLTTAIPYTIDEDFADRVRARVEVARSGGLRDIDPGRVSEQPLRSLRTPTAPDRSQMKLIGLIVAAVVVAIVLVVVVLKMVGSGEGNGGDARSTGDDHASQPIASDTKPVENPPVSAAEIVTRVEAFREWSRAFGGWFGHLATIRGDHRDVLLADSYLKEEVFRPIESARASGIVLDPLDVVSNPPPTIFALVTNPPAEVSESAIWGKTRAANLVIAEVVAGIESWPVRQRVLTLSKRLEDAGVMAPSAELRAAADAVSPNGGETLIPSMIALIKADDDERFGEAADEIELVLHAIRLMKASNDAVLIEEAQTFDDALARVRASSNLIELNENTSELGVVSGLAETISGFISERFAEVDPVVFAAQSRAHRSADRGVDRLRLWLSEARLPEMQKLDPALDPRPGAEVPLHLARLDESLRRFDAGARLEFAQEVDGLASRRVEIGDLANALDQLAWNTSTRGAVERGVADLNREIARLSRDIEDLRATISVDVAEKIAELESRQEVSTTGLVAANEIWRAGRDALLARFATDQNDPALFRDARALGEAIASIEDATLSVREPRVVPASWDSAAFRVRENALRNEAVRAHADALATGQYDEAVVTSIRNAVVASVDSSQLRLDAIIAEINAIQLRVDGLYGFDEESAGESSIQARLTRLGVDEAEARVLAPSVFAKVDAIEQVKAAGQDRQRVLALMRAGGNAEASFVAAWRSLGSVSPAWPGGVEELEEDIARSSRVRTAVVGVTDEQRQQQLVQTVDQIMRNRWRVAAESCEDRRSLAGVLRLRESCGGVPNDLSGPVRFNMSVFAVEQAIRADADDEENRAALRSLVASVESIGTEDPKAIAWTNELKAIAEESADEVPPLDPMTVGPARAGWRVVEGSTEDRLVYESTGSDRSQLAFRLVTLADGGGTYVCETELPLGVVAGLVESDRQFGRNLVETMGWFETQSDTRRGMLTWIWSGTKEEPVLDAADYWVTMRRITPEAYFLEGGATNYPQLDHPIQRVSLSDAMFIAARLGCRLPTLTEWRAAYAMVPTMSPDAGWNMRDDRYARQAARVLASGEPRPEELLPDVSALKPPAGDPCFPFDDGEVWLMPVNSGVNAPFRHIIGNVHEYVLVDIAGHPEALGSESVAPEDEVIARWYPIAREVQAGAIGGSALSRMNASPTEVTVVSDVQFGSSDIGIRVAFGTESGQVRRSVSSRVAEALMVAPFLKAE